MADALIIVGHGSTENADSSTPYLDYADKIAASNLFAQVLCCFWKEMPAMHEIELALHEHVTRVFVVPAFISEGYFTQQIIPREMQLEGSHCRKQHRDWYYTQPVGLHPNMTDVLANRVFSEVGQPESANTTLVIVGHGTGLNQQSRQIVEQQALLLKQRYAQFAEVTAAFMEEAPFIGEWQSWSSCDNVVVVPFFIADGLHSYQDIPVLLGIEQQVGPAASQREVFRHNPYSFGSKKLWYTSAIGSDAGMQQIIIDQVLSLCDQLHIQAPQGGQSGSDPQPSQLQQWFAKRLQQSGAQGIKIAQLQVFCEQQAYVLRPADSPQGSCRQLTCIEDLRQLQRYDSKGEFRPIAGSADLQSDWYYRCELLEELMAALDVIYPLALHKAMLAEQGRLPLQSLREKLERQTGMYAKKKLLGDEQLQQCASSLCRSKFNCLCAQAWQQQDLARHTAAANPHELPLWCQQACNAFVAALPKPS